MGTFSVEVRVDKDETRRDPIPWKDKGTFKNF